MSGVVVEMNIYGDKVNNEISKKWVQQERKKEGSMSPFKGKCFEFEHASVIEQY